MRFCYLRIALLTSAFAANAFADTAKTDVKLGALRTASSPTFVRDTFASPAITETHEPTSVDDEDRIHWTIKEFAKVIGRGHESKDLRGLIYKFLNPILRAKKTPKAAYEDLDLSGQTRNLLSNKEWVKWAYFVYQVGHQFEENAYEFMIAAMSVMYDTEALADILVAGIDDRETMFLAVKLAQASNDHVKHLFLQRQSVLANKLSFIFHQKQQPAETIYTNSRGRIFAYMEKHVENNKLPKKELSFLISYLSVLLNKKNAIGTALSVSNMFSEDAALLQTLLSVSNFHDEEWLKSFVSVWLDASLPPSQIVSMLLQGKAGADHFTILFSNKSSKNFWLHYFREYNEISTDDIVTRFANLDFEQLLQMLFAVVEQESPATDKTMAYSTILNILVSPSTAHLSPGHEYENKLMSILLSERTLPSDVLSMLMRDVADADRFNIVYVNTLSKRFWVRYLKIFTASSSYAEASKLTANVDFQQLLMMLHVMGMQELSEADRYSESCTVLKILISPEIRYVITNRNYLEEMVLYWFEQGLPPSDLVYMLVLEEVETDYFNILFTNELSSKLWKTYTKAYYANAPPQQDYIMLTLANVFGFANLERILEAASTIEATSEKANSLLIQLYWWKFGLNGGL